MSTEHGLREGEGNRGVESQVTINVDDLKKEITGPFSGLTAERDKDFISAFKISELVIEHFCRQALKDSSGQPKSELTSEEQILLYIHIGDALSQQGVQFEDRRFHAFAEECFEKAYRTSPPEDIVSLSSATSLVNSFCNYQMDLSPEEVNSDLWIREKIGIYSKALYTISDQYSRIHQVILAQADFAKKYKPEEPDSSSNS